MRRVKLCALWLLIALVLLVALELAVRLIAGTQYFDLPIFRATRALPGFTLIANVSVEVHQHGRLTEVTTGRSGRRVVPAAPARGGRAVHVIGGSQVFGIGLSDEETIPGQLQHKLGPGYRVVNHGVPRYGPFAYAGIMSGLRFRDIVIVVHDEATDVAECFFGNSDLTPRFGFLDSSRGRDFLPEPICRSALFQVACHVVDDVFGPDRVVPLQYHPYSRSAAAVMETRLERIYRLQAERRGSNLVWACVPWSATIHRDELDDHYPRLDRADATFELRDDCHLRGVFRAAAADAAAPLYQEDTSLLTPRGAGIVARELAEVIRTR